MHRNPDGQDRESNLSWGGCTSYEMTSEVPLKSPLKHPLEGALKSEVGSELEDQIRGQTWGSEAKATVAFLFKARVCDTTSARAKV